MSERPRISRPRPRIEALSDMVFGLSLSIGAIALIAQPPTSLGDINTHILVFILTFIVLITTWLAYTNVMSVLPIETGTVTLLNVALLLGVSISPFLLNTVEISNPLLSPSEAFMIRDYASILYALDVAALLAINGFFSHILAQEEKGLVSPELIGRFRANRNILLIFRRILSTLNSSTLRLHPVPQYTHTTLRMVHSHSILLG